jgi:hypothetical protein
MTDSDKCPRCGKVENLRHLIWDCTHSSNIWNLYNVMLRGVYPNSIDFVHTYESIFAACETPSTNVIKLKVIQEMIQIDRPKNWNSNKLTQIIRDLISIEKYNSKKLNIETKYRMKWDKYEHSLKDSQ